MKKEQTKNIYDKTEDSLEARLLQFYVIAQTIWAAFIGVASLLSGMPPITIKVFLGLAIILPIAYHTSYLIHKRKWFANIYLVAMVFVIPLLWYAIGGPRASGNILFVVELQLFTMCTRGKKQKVFIVLSLISSSLMSNMAGRFPDRVILPLNPMQLAKVGVYFGLSTSLLIMFLLLKQKSEYVAERRKVLETQEQLMLSNRLQKNFLANMSHEIRSPLGIVLGFNDLINDTQDLDKIHEYSENVSKAGKTLQVVINDILDYSKIESGKLDIIPEDYSVKEMMNEVCSDIELKCKEKELEFKYSISDEVPPFLFGDNIRIKQCMLNVLSNAVKYTDKGLVELKVEGTLNDKKDACELKISVRDTGRGMKEELIAKLFTSFQRLDEGQNRGIEGTGLGLAITKSLLDEMNGTISVESVFGEGSTFTIVLNQPIGKEVVSKTADGPKKLDRQLKILSVDDAPMNIRLLEKILAKHNYEVVSVDSGQKCLDELEKNKYDIVLLDHMMPEMDGVETFKRFKENQGVNEGTPVIMLTANAMTGVEKEYMDMGFAGYISKPINQTNLVNMINELCSSK